MAKEVRLPKLGETMEDATFISFSVKVGDEVKKGDFLFEIETDKAALEVESPADGFVKHILAEPGQILRVTEPVLVLGEKDEQLSSEFLKSLKIKTAPAAAKKPQTKKTNAISSNIKIRLGQTIPITAKQKIAAQKMLQSKREIPCFYLTVKADVTDLVELRDKLNKKSDIKISFNDFIMQAVATGLKKFPIMTGRLAHDSILLSENIGIGLAIVVPDGLVAPIVKNVNEKNLTQIAADSAKLIEKAQNNKLSPADFEGGCITVSNLGTFGIESFIPIVIPGQCSILGIGTITDTCKPNNNDDILVRRLMSLTLSADHRITNGAYAAGFLDFARKLLEDTSNFA